MEKISMFGLDTAKSVFEVHGRNARGAVVLRRRLKRIQVEEFFAAQPPAMIGLEACAAAHHWGRVLSKLGLTPREHSSARPGASDRSPNVATAACGACSCSAPPPGYAMSAKTPRKAARGCAACWRVARSRSWPSPRPPAPRASSGPCSRTTNPIARQPSAEPLNPFARSTAATDGEIGRHTGPGTLRAVIARQSAPG